MNFYLTQNFEQNNLVHTLFITCLLIFIYSLHKYKRKKDVSPLKTKQSPPKVAYSLPYIGHLHRIIRKPHEILFEWSQAYGKIYEIKLGTQSVVILNGVNIIRNAFIKNSESFSNRPSLYMLDKTLKGMGILSSKYKKSYVEHKLFTVSCINNFLKFNKNEQILTNINNYIHELKSTKPHNLNHQTHLHEFKLNIGVIIAQNLLKFLFNAKSIEKRKLIEIISIIDENFKNTTLISAYNYLPVTRVFQTSITNNANKVGQFLFGVMQDSQTTTTTTTELNPNEPCVSLLDAYLSSNDKCSFNKDELFILVQDIFLSGTETLINTLMWAFLYASYFDCFQQAIHAEIDEVIGRGGRVHAECKSKMPFIEAFLYETMRHQCSGPILVPRETTRDTVIDGYRINKGTAVFANIWSCVRDPLHWTNPSEFNPRRFLDSNGQCIHNNPAMIIFGLGKRACIGETMGKLELFLIFTGFMQKIKIKLVERPNSIDDCANYGVTIYPTNVLFEFDIR